MEKHIIRWHDGQDAWCMEIKPGSVSFKTTSKDIPKETLEAHGKVWGEAFAFINGAFANELEKPTTKPRWQ